MTHLSNLSGLRVNKDGTVSREAMKAHIAELQQMMRDIQVELNALSGGGRGQVPATTTGGKRTPFRFAEPSAATTDQKVQATRSLRTATKSRVAHDLTTRKEVDAKVASASSASGFMDLISDQIVTSGNKDFGSISFQVEAFTLDVSASLTNADLSGATVWSLSPNAATVTAGPIIRGIAAPADFFGALRILIWHGTNSALRLAHLSTASGMSSIRRINTMSLTTADTLASPQLITTSGPGAFVLYYDLNVSQWIVIARTA